MGHMHIEAMIFCAAMPLLGFLPQPMVDGRCPGFATSVAGRWAVPLLLAIKAHPGLKSFAGGIYVCDFGDFCKSVAFECTNLECRPYGGIF